LKGKNSLIYGEKLNECEFGNPGMAVAGMGDTLSGIIAALLAQHVGIEESANLGVNIHGFAADLVAKKQGEIGMVPNDLLTYLPLIINGKI
jgi:NAD(P)H-hydrate epimerase